MMGRDHRAKRTRREQGRRRSGGGTILGIFIGLILGLGIAAAVFYYISRSPNPFQGQSAVAPKNDTATLPAAPGPAANAPPDKPRFDFYKILPGAEDKTGGERKPVSGKAAEAAKPPESKAGKPAEARVAESRSGDAKPADQFFLQVGSFANAADAENEKARLALLGFEAVIQVATLADKGQRHRVRLGPYASVEEMNRSKIELSKRGVEATVIKNP